MKGVRPIKHSEVAQISNSKKMIVRAYNQGDFERVATLASVFQKNYPNDNFGHKAMGAVFAAKEDFDAAVKQNNMALSICPNDAELLSNQGRALQALGAYGAAEECYRNAIKIGGSRKEAYFNLGTLLHRQGRYDEAVDSYRHAINITPALARELTNLGNVYLEVGDLDKAKSVYLEAVEIDPRYIDGYFNLSSCTDSIEISAKWLDECLKLDSNYLPAKITKTVFQYYQGETDGFYELIDGEYVDHPLTRSISWVLGLGKLPQLHFNKWDFFRSVAKYSDQTRPFYEFGVWRGSSFRFLRTLYKSGYGFDTFTGLPEDWNVGTHTEASGSYSSDGIIPDIEGGSFIVGEFKSTLPQFFASHKPMASLINFDADTYESTYTALIYSRPVIDENTILVFDEFLVNESWERDEYKALEEFCSLHRLTYEVLGVSFFTKQVALRLQSMLSS